MGFTDVAFGTFAPWHMRNHLAYGVIAASAAEGARVLANAADARLVQSTIAVRRTAIVSGFCASEIWVTMRRIGRTETSSDSVIVPALSTESAPLGFARIDLIVSANATLERIPSASGFTSAVVASEEVGADGVVTAGGGQAVVHIARTFQSGVAHEAGRTEAVRSVVP